jgi:hypothetical protein
VEEEETTTQVEGSASGGEACEEALAGPAAQLLPLPALTPAAEDAEPAVDSSLAGAEAVAADGGSSEAPHAALDAALLSDDAVSVEGRGEEPAELELEVAGSGSRGGTAPESATAQAPPCLRVRRATSSSSLEGAALVTLRVPRKCWPASPRAPLRSPPASSRITPRQLRHLESLRRQRAQQEEEALECLPSALRVAAEAAEAGMAADPLARAQEQGASKQSPSARRALLGGPQVGSPGARRVGSAGRVRLS